jgi:Asp-tRNA(Asn)/Glu-tRNA(Gln) amidotransferase A subunit family amidase
VIGRPEQWSATEAAAAIRSGRLTSEALVRACLARIAEREPVVHAWAHLDPEPAIAAARAADRGSPRGPLHGVPLGVKDVIDTFDMPTRHGSPIYHDNRPATDAACVAPCRDAGMIVLGKTATAELASLHPAATTNPHDPEHTPGGSSSGSAAAVADFMVPLALGTQTAGSLIRPAAFCGVIGYKPSFGQIRRAGVKRQSETLDTVGLIARTLDDLVALRAVMLGEAPAALADPPAPRIGVCRRLRWEQRAPETDRLLERTASALAARGARVTDIALPGELDELLAAHRTINTVEASRNYSLERTEHRDRLSPALLDMLAYGASWTPADYAAAHALAARWRDHFDRLLAERVDLVLTASAPGEAPAGLVSTGDPQCNAVWTLAGAPCITLPAGTGPRGLPLGVQLVGARGADHRLLAAARWVSHRPG